MQDNTFGRRRFLKLGGAGSAVGLASLSGCMMTKGSMAPSMGFMQGVKGLKMFKGAPAHGEYPAKEMTMSMEGMEMKGVMVKLVAKPDDSNNYHFMPHVAWVKPGTKVIWGHADIEGVSEPRTHSATSFGASDQFPRLIPETGHHFDSGYIPGLHGEKPVKEGIDHRFNQRISEKLKELGNPIGRGPFTHTFEEPGVYFYYCQNHHQFKMAGAIVVGQDASTPYWGEKGSKANGVSANPPGWAPGMTTPIKQIRKADRLHGKPVASQIEELRMMIHSGGEMGHGGHGE